MSDYSGYVGNTPMEFGTPINTGSVVNRQPRPGTLKERKIADAMAKLLDTLDVDTHWIVFCFRDKGSAMQARMAELCFAFIRHWAIRYDTGNVRKGQALYPVCEKAYRMYMATTDRDVGADGWEAARITG